MSSSYDSALRRRGRLGKLLLLVLAVVVCAVVGFLVGDRLMALRGPGSAGLPASDGAEEAGPATPPRRLSTEEMVARRLDAVAVDEARRRLQAAIGAPSHLSQWSSRASTAGTVPPAGAASVSGETAAPDAASRLDEPRDRTRRDERLRARDRLGLRPAPRWVDEPSSPPRRFMPVLDLEVVDPYPPTPGGDATGPRDERPE